jgi:hypothetical protein
VATGLRPKILDELALNGVEVPAHLFRNDEDSLSGSNGRPGGRHHRPARPGRAVEPPSEEMYEMLARRREGK